MSSMNNDNVKKLSTRDTNVDIIKAIGIICMVAGHCDSPITKFIYLFHMAIFFIASGYCFKETNSDNFQNLRKFFSRKVQTLWLPYVLWTSIYSLLHNIFIKINVYTNNSSILNYIHGEYIGTTDYWSIRDILINIVKSMALHGGTQIGGALWFLATLMEISVLYCLNDCIIKKLNGGG